MCGGPDSSTSLYWSPTLLKRASSLTRHMGVFFSLLFATAVVGCSPLQEGGDGPSCSAGAHSPLGPELSMLRPLRVKSAAPRQVTLFCEPRPRTHARLYTRALISATFRQRVLARACSACERGTTRVTATSSRRQASRAFGWRDTLTTHDQSSNWDTAVQAVNAILSPDLVGAQKQTTKRWQTVKKILVRRRRLNPTRCSLR